MPVDDVKLSNNVPTFRSVRFGGGDGRWRIDGANERIVSVLAGEISIRMVVLTYYLSRIPISYRRHCPLVRFCLVVRCSQQWPKAQETRPTFQLTGRRRTRNTWAYWAEMGHFVRNNPLSIGVVVLDLPRLSYVLSIPTSFPSSTGS